ncbi:TetR/AcrR family transcriptional regulator [Kitasatospora sp. MAP5-34]|uniref:TetR/AcrR family transcriptional regulator n=1 Tax=Kitasatospora sp. MAP5-34 TaxID=3035102 RepID=UPI002476DFBA|nr:TetR/AcrR family transcriptional regulator [Kitasatospora sp. MAP5-34]
MSNDQAVSAIPRRDQIRKEAARLFAARGFLGVGVDEIGKAVGISGPGLYRHFPGKDAMLADLLVGISERLLEEGRRRVGDAGSAAGALDALIGGHVEFALDDQDLIILHDRELLHLKEEDRRHVRRLQRRYVELWVEVVREAFPALATPEAAPFARASVHAVFGLINSTPHSAAPQPTAGDKGGLPRDAMASLLHGLAQGAFTAAAATATATATAPGSAAPAAPSSSDSVSSASD